MKTKQELIDEFRHAVSGELCDFIKDDLRGAELSVKLRQALRKIDALAGAFADQLSPKPANGQPANGAVRKVTT